MTDSHTGRPQGEAEAARDAGPISAQVLRGISRNSLFLIGGEFVSRGIGFVYILIVARLLGVEDFGNFSLIVSFVMIATAGVEFGLNRLIVRDLARNPELLRPYLAALLPLRAALALAGYAALIALVWLAGYSARLVALTAVAGLCLLPASIGLIYAAVFHARQQMRYSAASDIVMAVVQAAAGSAALAMGAGLPGVLLAAVGANVAYLVFIARQAWGCGYWSAPQLSRRVALDLLRRSAPFAVVSFLAILSSRSELLILGWFAPAQDLGLFSAAVKFPEIALLLPAVLASAAAPVMARCYTGSRRDLHAVYLWSVRRVLTVTLPVALAGIALADGIMSWLFTPDYLSAAPLLQVLFCAFPLTSLQIINNAVFTMSNRPRIAVVAAAVSTIIQFAVGLALVPRFGAAGAAASVLASQALNLALSQWWVGRWFVDTTGLVRHLAAPLIAGSIGGGAALVLVTPWGAWSALPVLAAYGLALALATTLWPPTPTSKLTENT